MPPCRSGRREEKGGASFSWGITSQSPPHLPPCSHSAHVRPSPRAPHRTPTHSYLHAALSVSSFALHSTPHLLLPFTTRRRFLPSLRHLAEILMCTSIFLSLRLSLTLSPHTRSTHSWIITLTLACFYCFLVASRSPEAELSGGQGLPGLC